MSHLKMYHECSVCKSSSGRKLGRLEYTLLDDNPLSNKYNVVACKNCGFILCDTQSTQKDYDNFYEKYFYSSAYINRETDDNELQYITNTIQTMLSCIEDLNLTSNIFDIGCGNGILLKRLKNLGYKNLYGVDISQSCVNTLKNEGINIKNGSITDIPFKNVKADIIILSHVLEHVIDIKLALQSIKNKLSNNGSVYVEVPNANEYDIENCSPIRYFYLQHIIHFDNFHLSNMFRANGYVEIKSGNSYRKEGNLTMPCIWGTFRKNDNNELINDKIIDNETNNRNFCLSDKIKRWFNNINLDNNNILKDLVSNKKDIYIWGLGIHINMMLSMSPLKNCKIKYYVDNDERNRKRTINGCEIHSIDILKNATENDVIIIGAPTHTKEMYNYLIDILNFKGEVIVIGFVNVYSLKRNVE